ncbi:FAD-dependent oxidoreductase, partial [Candidatus Saccharibacteria bacterium]|nr:FAD-dependent oxidoreductase [Candidatus Saccharibacteria bacterium]
MKTKLTFISKNHISSDIWQLHFAKPNDFTFTAGQYIEITIADPHPDDRGIKRWFTISASPTEKNLILTTRLIETKHSEFKNDLFQLKKGDEIDISGPDGEFVLPDSQERILWIAGGIGVTPFIAQMQFLLDNNDLEWDITLLHGLRSLDENPCAVLIKECQEKMPHFTVEHVLSENIPSDWQGQTGYINEQLITKIVP